MLFDFFDYPGILAQAIYFTRWVCVVFWLKNVIRRQLQTENIVIDLAMKWPNEGYPTDLKNQ